jgi:hypothetical protein
LLIEASPERLHGLEAFHRETRSDIGEEKADKKNQLHPILCVNRTKQKQQEESTAPVHYILLLAG